MNFPDPAGEGSPDSIARLYECVDGEYRPVPDEYLVPVRGRGRRANPHDLRGDCSTAHDCAVSKGCLARQVFIEQ
jgi:hypothetical protein